VDAVIEQVLPIAGIFIGACFTAYILWHRSQALAPITALKRETTLLLPFALLMLFIVLDPKVHWEALSLLQLWLLPLIGILTCLPLGLFILGSKHVSFSQISLYQFISPLVGTLVAVELFQENFSLSKMLVYGGLIGILCVNLHLTRRQLVAQNTLAKKVLNSHAEEMSHAAKVNSL
jgi:chloramphenicol-sensitive protein RarD